MFYEQQTFSFAYLSCDSITFGFVSQLSILLSAKLRISAKPQVTCNSLIKFLFSTITRLASWSLIVSMIRYSTLILNRL
jgi:hypothetical protein